MDSVFFRQQHTSATPIGLRDNPNPDTVLEGVDRHEPKAFPEG